MRRIAEVRIDDATTILVEADDVPQQGPPPGLTRAGAQQQVQARVEETLKGALERLRPAIAQVKAALDDLNRPAEIGLEFGIKFTTNAGVVFAGTAVEGTFKVSLTWRNEPTVLPAVPTGSIGAQPTPAAGESG